MNEIERVMRLTPQEILNGPPSDLDTLIKYHRQARAMADAGHKPKKLEGPKIDLVKLALVKPAAPIKRRKL